MTVVKPTLKLHIHRDDLINLYNLLYKNVDFGEIERIRWINESAIAYTRDSQIKSNLVEVKLTLQDAALLSKHFQPIQYHI